MTDRTADALSKVPAVTLAFWVIKILATTLGETGGDAVSMSWLGETTPNAGSGGLNGYLVGTAIFGAVLVGLVWLQIKAQRLPLALLGDDNCIDNGRHYARGLCYSVYWPWLPRWLIVAVELGRDLALHMASSARNGRRESHRNRARGNLLLGHDHLFPNTRYRAGGLGG